LLPIDLRGQGFESVQHESTATGADLTGLVRTPWDGDLHRRTAVDVLPADGMQEVRGSNPRSSTNFPRSDPNFQPSKAAFKIV
jgi:hypothetical protein